MSHPPPNPRALLREAGLAAKKSWGQNFLCDTHVLAAIAGATNAGPGQPVVELGAGLGSLTHFLLERGGRVLAIERDRDLIPLLRAGLAWAGNLEVVEADAATVDYSAIAATLGCPPVVCGNLPYHIASRIIVSVADQAAAMRGAVFMVQREVAERLAARPGSRVYGLLSVLVQRAFTVALVRKVSPGAFHPRPRVTSAVVRLDPRGDGSRHNAWLVAAARAAFAARRKTVRNAIAHSLGAETTAVEEALVAARVDPRARAEALSVDDFDRVGAALTALGLLP